MSSWDMTTTSTAMGQSYSMHRSGPTQEAQSVGMVYAVLSHECNNPRDVFYIPSDGYRGHDHELAALLLTALVVCCPSHYMCSPLLLYYIERHW